MAKKAKHDGHELPPLGALVIHPEKTNCALVTMAERNVEGAAIVVVRWMLDGREQSYSAGALVGFGWQFLF